MFNSKENAHDSLVALENKLKRNFVRTEVAYNTSEPILEQLLQVYSQHSGANVRLYWSYLSELNGPKWFTDAVVSKIKSIDLMQLAQDSDLRKQIDVYKSVFQDSVGVLAVAHSQGNFYLESVRDLLLNENFEQIATLATVSVATPAPAAIGKYVTLDTDYVIRSVPYALPANEHNIDHDLVDHEFIKNYLNGTPSGEDIVKLADDAIARVDDDIENQTGANYLDESLHPMRRWLNNIKRAPSKPLPLYQCLAINLFLKTDHWFGESCKERSLDSVSDYAHECFEVEWSQKGSHHGFAPACPLPGYRRQHPEFNELPESAKTFFSSHEECMWTVEDTHGRLTPDLLEKALIFIGNPIN